MYLLLLALLALTLAVPLGRACPRSCNCYQANEVHCTFRSLITIPSGLPTHTRRINLGFNSISSISDNSLAGLRRVELLMLHGNNLHQIPNGVFQDMKSLQILKLSYNKLREISSSLTFAGLTSMLRLYLDHNLLQHIHPRALLQLPNLRLLRLQGNRLHQLHPHSLCTLSLLNTYYFSTLRNLDLSNNSLTTLPKEILETAPLLETFVMQTNPWSCDCRMTWFLSWSLAHPGLMKCPRGPQCPICSSPTSLQGQDMLEKTDLSCTSPVILSSEREKHLEMELSEIQTIQAFRKPLGNASLSLSDQEGDSVDLTCNISYSTNSQGIFPAPDLSLSSTSPLSLSLSLSLECPVDGDNYEKLWRILAYYSETAVHLEREIMLSKAPVLAFRYKQAVEKEGFHHTSVRVSIKAWPHWLLQPAISIQLNRLQSSRDRVHLLLSTTVSAHPDSTSHLSAVSQPWLMISTNHTITAMAAIAGSKVELSCPLLSSGNPDVQWILPGKSTFISLSSNPGQRVQASSSGLILEKVELSDAGLYYCVASAERDVDVLAVRLIVDRPSLPPRVEQRGPPVTGMVGEPISLSCKTSGAPEPYISWLLPDGNLLHQGLANSDGLTLQENGSLFLAHPSLRDAGHYLCIAVNQYGADSLSMQLDLHSQPASPLRTSLSRGPQSAAGLSTKIRAPLLHQPIEEDGSGDGKEEVETTSAANRSHPRSLQPVQNRRHPAGKPRRRGPVRVGPVKRVEMPSSTTEQRRNRFDSRHRITTNKQRIDPQKWADLLFKIRQKTALHNNSQAINEVKPTADALESGEDSGRHEEENGTEKSPAEGAVVKVESEGSSIDDSALREDGLQSVHHVHMEPQTHRETGTDQETDTDVERGIERSAETQTDMANESERHMQTDKVTETGPQTVTEPPTHSDLVTSKPLPGMNEIVVEMKQQGNPSTSGTRPQNSKPGLFLNLVPNSRPQSPWNTRRRIGQRRRIINRPRGRPVTLPQTLPDPRSLKPQIRTSDTTTNQMNTTLTLTSSRTTSATLFTRNAYIQSTTGKMGLLSPPALLPNTPSAAPSDSASPFKLSYSMTPSLDAAPSPSSFSPSHRKTHIDITTPSAFTPDTVDFGLSNTLPLMYTHSGIALAKTHKPSTWIYTRIRTHGKDVDRTSSKHSQELHRNLSHSITHLSIFSSTVPSISTTATEKIATSVLPQSTTNSGSRTRTSTTTTTKHIFPIISTTTTDSPLTATPAVVVNPVFTNTRTTTIPTFTSTPTTLIHPTSTTIPNTLSSTVARTTTSTIPTTDSTSTTTSTPRTTVSWVFIPIPNATTSAITRTTTSARTSSRNRPSLDFDSRGKFISIVPNQSRPSTDWRNSGVNSIPDSHHSRPQRPPSLPLPASPGVLRSRPRIADPHIRTVSVPADSTARLACEAVGEPKPSITWTKVSTGTVISAHSRTQRFEVLPNGTLVIQSVQLQDRGTYICSANSFLGRDRMLTTLEVWTRPPRMMLLSYREATIHQGGEMYLECQADGVPPPLLSWVLPDRSILTSGSPSHGRFTMDTNGTLHISVTTPSDRGLYRCMASNSAGVVSASVRVHVSSLPPVIQQLREAQLVLSPAMPLYAHCSARGAPPPTVRWRIPDGTLIRPSQFVHGNLFVLPNGTLHIRKVGLRDSGSYECTATNAVGADKRVVRVEVQTVGVGSPERAKNSGTEPSPASSVKKDVTSLQNYPSEQLNTDKTRSSSPSSFDRSRTFLHKTNSPRSSDPPPPVSTNSPLKINKVVMQLIRTNITASPPSSGSTNNTKLSPSFVNNKGVVLPSPSDKNRAAAVLHSLPISPFSKARIVSTSPSITTVHYGMILQLHCSVTGNPSPTIIWRTPSRKLVDTHFSFDRRLKVHPNGTLTVQAVTEKDAGDYLCVARNKVADDYRLLRVSVATKPAKIEPKQPFNQMVSFGGPLKVDCQASGLPDPAVHWSLPDGTMVNSVLHGEEIGGRARRLTVFGNGTLLVPAVGMGEEGEYTCYAENQGGQDTMKVKVKVMMTSPPTFSDDIFHIIKVRQGMTAAVRCRAIGDPTPTVTWTSPVNRVIPQSSDSGYFAQRVQMLSDGTLEVHFAQKSDSGNYTCIARNSVGERLRVVGLEVEVPHHGLSGHFGQSGVAVKEGRAWSKSNGPSSGHSSSRSGDIIDSSELSRSSPVYGLYHGFRRNFNSNNSNNNAHSENNGSIRNTVQSTGISIPSTGFHPARRSGNRVHGPTGRVPPQLDSAVSVSISETRNLAIKADNTGINTPADLSSSTNSEGNSQKQFGGIARSSNEVTRRTTDTDPSTSKINGRLSATLRNNDVFSGRASINGSATGTLMGNGFSGSSSRGVIMIGSDVTDDNIGEGVAPGHNSEGTGASGLRNSTNTAVNVTTAKQRVVKGQTVLLPCPSQGYPPPRLSWLLPGNGVLPAPYYGSRLTVYRNGSLELRGVRSSDGGILVCVVRGEREETRIQVELVVSEEQDNVRLSNRAPVAESPLQKTPVLYSIPHTGTSVDSWPALAKKPQSRIPITEKPPQRPSTVPAEPPIHSSGPVSKPVVTTRTASLVSIINGETLHLPCPVPQPPGSNQGSLTWTLPNGKVLPRGESADSGQYYVQADGTLKVLKAFVHDRGTYSCRSTSYDASSVFIGTVPVIVIAYPPRITTGPSPVTYTQPGVAVELPCLVIATPRATITWETPDLSQLKVINQARTYGNHYLRAQGSLVIQNPTSRDTGFYRCTANNVIGTDTKVTYLHVI
ncbi:matrix-remodeling-associated protein 5-like [Thalassophryne amazonica]|uniref:matrix-remodeling-associated protein 5-like n=1 Tax=Thalassophryne amazonica TaxID=390379 RepID=UPI0014718C7C|nr:matrix-remodeling-associated protein 5-like [Thalassophryne amazonica]